MVQHVTNCYCDARWVEFVQIARDQKGEYVGLMVVDTDEKVERGFQVESAVVSLQKRTGFGQNQKAGGFILCNALQNQFPQVRS
jgi:hypothetical protein